MRIGGLGIGTFLILVCGALYILICFAGLSHKSPGSLYLISTCAYGLLVVSLLLAKRRDEYSDEVGLKTDPLWIVRVSFGFMLGCSCCIGSFLLVRHSTIRMIKGKPVYDELQSPSHHLF